MTRQSIAANSSHSGEPIRSFALSSFWECCKELPEPVQKLADKQFRLFRQDPFHPSLGFALGEQIWTVEVGRGYRAIAPRRDEDCNWFWIGSREAYNKLLKRVK